jgi:predicted outer membrane lipoprotein
VTWLIALLIACAIAILFGLSRWRHGDEDMGSVSSQWLAEYKQDRSL